MKWKLYFFRFSWCPSVRGGLVCDHVTSVCTVALQCRVTHCVEQTGTAKSLSSLVFGTDEDLDNYLTMAMSGVKLTEGCMNTYQDIQKSKKHRYAVFVIREGQIDVETVSLHFSVVSSIQLFLVLTIGVVKILSLD